MIPQIGGMSEAKILPAELLAELVAIPSVNPVYGGTGEAAISDWVAGWLRERGVGVALFGEDETRQNVLCKIGEGDEPALLLEAHMDTVGVEGWAKGSPFSLEKRGDRFYGRGACDTKGSLCAFMLVADYFAKRPESLKRPLVFCATVDEENLQVGAFELADKLRSLNVGFAITGEPTLSRVVARHKGVCRYVITTVGKAAHGSTPELGKNAIYDSARICLDYAELAKSLAEEAGKAAIERGALNVGTIRGGIGFNVVPDRCQFEIDRRIGVGESLSKVRRELREFAMSHGGELEAFLERPALTGERSEAFVADMLKAAAAVDSPTHAIDASYMTNAVAYEAVGVPAVVFGPGDIAQAHKSDEYIAEGEIERSVEILKAYLSR